MPKVDGFLGPDGVNHKPGDVVDLPERYKGLNWLQPVDSGKPKMVPAASAVMAATKVEVPSLAKAPEKVTEKKSKKAQ